MHVNLFVVTAGNTSECLSVFLTTQSGANHAANCNRCDFDTKSQVDCKSEVYEVQEQCMVGSTTIDLKCCFRLDCCEEIQSQVCILQRS